MNLLSNSRIAIRAMLRRPVRTFLVLQGVIWAAAIIVFPAAIEKGSIRNAIQNAAKFKTNQITVLAHPKPEAEPLKLSDVPAVQAALAEKKCSVTPYRTCAGEVFVGTEVIRTTIVGTDQTSPATRSFYTSRGRFLTAEDVKEKHPVCVLEALAAKELFPNRSPLGQEITLRYGGRLSTVQVVGVMEKREPEELATDDHGFRREEIAGDSRSRWLGRLLRKMSRKIKSMMGILEEGAAWKRTEKCVQIPLTLIPREDDSIDWLIVKTDPLQVLETARLIQRTLVDRNKEPVLLYNIFLPILLSDQLKVKDDLTVALFILCLIMGGIMVTNIMLMSIMERSREIAIRRVEGASKGDVIRQFLAEGVVLCVTGALLGVPLGLGLAYVASLFEPYAISAVGLPLTEALVAMACTVVLGTVAAIFPAVRAANLDPVVILQNE